MNDYAGTDHLVIYEMVKAGEFGQVNGYATKLNGIRNRLGGHILALREQLAGLSAVWSDGAGSERMTADLEAVTGYLDLLAAGLSGQPSSYSDLVAQGAADLAAAQPPAVLPLPPPPGLDVGSLKSDKQQSLLAASLNPVLEPVVLQNIHAAYDTRIEQAVAAQQLAGQTATSLDGQYRTLLARLTPPPEPPALVSAAGATGPLAPTVGGGSVGDTAWQSGSAGNGGWSSAGAAAGAGSAGGSGAVPIAPVTDSVVTAGRTPVAGAGGFSGESVGIGGTGGVLGSGLLAGSGNGGWNDAAGGIHPTGAHGGPGAQGGPGAHGGPGAQGGQGVVGADWPRGVPLSAVLRADPAALTGGWDATATAAGSAQQAAGSAAAGHRTLPGGLVFDPISGAPVTADAGQFGVVDRPRVSPWEVAGVGGLAALAGGALYLARSGAGAGGVAVTGAVGGGSGVVGSAGYGGSGSAVSGSAGNGSAGSGSAGSGSAGSGSAGSGTVSNGALGNGSGAAGPTGAGAANNAAAAGRGLLPGSGGPNSMVQGGQIGQSGRLATGSVGYGSGRPVAPGSSIGGGQQSSRVTWLVEDRDLYGIGPSVAAVIEVPIEPS